MEAEARELAILMRAQMDAHILIVDGNISYALSQLESAIINHIANEYGLNQEERKARHRREMHEAFQAGVKPLIDPVTAQKRAYGDRGQ